MLLVAYECALCTLQIIAEPLPGIAETFPKIQCYPVIIHDSRLTWIKLPVAWIIRISERTLLLILEIYWCQVFPIGLSSKTSWKRYKFTLLNKLLGSKHVYLIHRLYTGHYNKCKFYMIFLHYYYYICFILQGNENSWRVLVRHKWNDQSTGRRWELFI